MPAFPSIKPTQMPMPSAEQMPMAPLSPVPQAAKTPGLDINSQIKAIWADGSLSDEQKKQMISKIIQGSETAAQGVTPPQEGPGSF